MRFISILTHNPTNHLPTEAEMASMHKLRVESMKAGWLIECEAVTFGTTGVRVHKAASGEVTVTDGPLAETKEVRRLRCPPTAPRARKKQLNTRGVSSTTSIRERAREPGRAGRPTSFSRCRREKDSSFSEPDFQRSGNSTNKRRVSVPSPRRRLEKVQ